MRTAPNSNHRIYAIVCVLVISTFLYLSTLDTGLQPYELHGGDLITHQYAQVQARPSNAPGYPLYTMGGWLWFHTLKGLLSLGSISYPNPLPLLSSYSMIWALASLATFFCIVLHVTEENQYSYAHLTTVIGITLFWAVTYFFWYYATTTEQYSSAIAQTLVIILVYLHWRRGPPISGKFWLLASLCGISLAHMLTVAFIVPPLIIVILHQHPRLIRSPKAVLGSTIAAILPLTSYSYVWLRGATHPEWWGDGSWTNAQSWFWTFISTAQGRDELMRSLEPGRPIFGNGFPQLIWHELSLPMLVMGIAGLILLEYRLRWLMISTIGIYAIFCWFYRFGNWFQVILPAYPILLTGAAVAITRAAQIFLSWLQAASPFPPLVNRRLVHALVGLLLGSAILWRMTLSLPAADSRYRPEDNALDTAAVLLDQPLPKESGLFASVDTSLALDYLINIWQVRSDVSTVSSPIAVQYLRDGHTLLATWPAMPTLLSELPPDIVWHAVPFSPDWIRLSTAPEEPISTQDGSGSERIMLNQELVPDLLLVDIEIKPSPDGKPVVANDAPGLDVILRWQVTNNRWPEEISISVRATDNGAVIPKQEGIIQQDHAQPVQWQMVRSDSEPRNLLIDPYRLDFGQVAVDQINTISIVLYRRHDGRFEDLAQVNIPIQPSLP